VGTAPYAFYVQILIFHLVLSAYIFHCKCGAFIMYNCRSKEKLFIISENFFRSQKFLDMFMIFFMKIKAKRHANTQTKRNKNMSSKARERKENRCVWKCLLLGSKCLSNVTLAPMNFSFSRAEKSTQKKSHEREFMKINKIIKNSAWSFRRIWKIWNFLRCLKWWNFSLGRLFLRRNFPED
jgi:hypothetical protein